MREEKTITVAHEGVRTKNRAERGRREKGLCGSFGVGASENTFGRANMAPAMGVRPASRGMGRGPGRSSPWGPSGPCGMPRENPANVTTDFSVRVWSSSFVGSVITPRQGHRVGVGILSAALSFGTLMCAFTLAHAPSHFIQGLFWGFLPMTHPLTPFGWTQPRLDLLQSLPRCAPASPQDSVPLSAVAFAKQLSKNYCKKSFWGRPPPLGFEHPGGRSAHSSLCPQP